MGDTLSFTVHRLPPTFTLAKKYRQTPPLCTAHNCEQSTVKQ
jgi:hypothetical protein